MCGGLGKSATFDVFHATWHVSSGGNALKAQGTTLNFGKAVKIHTQNCVSSTFRVQSDGADAKVLSTRIIMGGRFVLRNRLQAQNCV
jgi:hypothetical protein